MEQITSRHNPLALQIRRLNQQREARTQLGLFCAEGPKLLEEAEKAGVAVDTVVAARGAGVPVPPGARGVEVPRDLLESLCDTKTPQGVLFLAPLPDTAPPERLPGRRYLVLDGVQDPGNVGAIWRTADALGADGLILLPGCADPFSPKVVRATMGACFRLPVYQMQAGQLPGLLERSGLPLYAAAVRADTLDLRQARLERCAVVIGSEGRGVSRQVLELCRQTVRIPMRARCESLNAAAAAAVVLWEMCRQEERLEE